MNEAIERLRHYTEWLGLPETATIDECLQALLECLNADKRTAENAADLISMIGPISHQVIPALIKNLDHDERAAQSMRRALNGMGPDALGQLVTELDTATKWHRESILLAIGEFGPQGSIAIPSLERHIESDEDLSTSVAAAIAHVRVIGPNSHNILHVAKGLFPQEFVVPEIGGHAYRTIYANPSFASEVLPMLIGSLVISQYDSYYGVFPCELLGGIGFRALPAVPALQRASCGDIEVSKAAKFALDQIYTSLKKRRLLNSALERAFDCNTATSLDACAALIVAGSNSLQQLLRSLGHRDVEMRRGAILSIGSFGVAAQSSLPAIKDLTHNEDIVLRAYAAVANWQISGKAKRNASIVVEVLKENEPRKCPVAWFARCLHTMGPDAVEAVPKLLDLLQNSTTTYLREYAATALGGIGFEAAYEIPLLREILDERATGDKEWCERYTLRLEAERACYPIYALASLSEVILEMSTPEGKPIDLLSDASTSDPS
ncbi:MAG: hypothetical protein ABL921_20660 [Pirellula sp.]